MNFVNDSWATESGRVDILHEISISSQHQAAPRENHMRQPLQIFSHSERKCKLTLFVDPNLPAFNESQFSHDTSEFLECHRDVEEELPGKFPRPRGKPVVTAAFVDASHAANEVTWRSHSRHIVFVNGAPVKWHSERWNTVETSAVSSGFTAMKHCIKDVECSRFELRMFGIPLDEHKPETRILCDNEAVVKNSSEVESTLSKKHSAVACHFARWNVAAKVCLVGWIKTHENIADAVTKLLLKPNVIIHFAIGCVDSNSDKPIVGFTGSLEGSKLEDLD